MKRTRLSFAVITAVLGLAMMPAASGAVLEASFEGVATGSRVYSPDPTRTDFDGEVVTGSFSIDSGAPPIYSELRDGSGYSTIASTTAGLTIHAHGVVATYGNDSARPQYGSVTLTSAGGQQEALIVVDAGNPYHNALIRLSGPLFSGVDLSTLHAGDVDLSRSFIAFFDSREFGSGVTLTRLEFASAVPEPAAAWLMLGGLATLAEVARIRRRRPSVPRRLLVLDRR